MTDKKVIKYLNSEQELEHIKKLGFHVVPLSENEERFEKSQTWDGMGNYTPDQIKLYETFRDRYTGSPMSNDQNFTQLKAMHKKFADEVTTEYYFNMGSVIDKDGFRYLSLPANTTFYKGVKYFYSTMINAPYFWCATKRTALEFARDYEGSVLIYKADEPLDLFILDEQNLKALYDKVTEKEKQIISGVFGIGLTFDEYKRIMCIKKPSWCNELWFYNEHIVSEKDGEPIRMKYPTHLHSGWDLHDLLFAKLPELQGTIIPYHISPFNRDQFEEVCLRNTSDIKLVKDDPLYWGNWDLKLPDETRFLLNESYPRNYNFKVFNWYTDPMHSNIMNGLDNIKIPTKTKKYRIITYNVKKFSSANALMPPDKVCNSLASIIPRLSANIVVLQDVPGSFLGRLKIPGFHMTSTTNGGYSSSPGQGPQLVVLSDQPLSNAQIVKFNYKGKHRNSIMLDYHGMSGDGMSGDGMKILATSIETGSGYDGLRFFCTISEFVYKYQENIKARTQHIESLTQEKPDLIVGNFEAAPDDKEVGILIDKGYTPDTSENTSIHNTKMDYVFCNKKISSESNVLNYYESDHMPLLFDFDVLISGGDPTSNGVDPTSVPTNVSKVWSLLQYVGVAFIIFVLICLIFYICIMDWNTPDQTDKISVRMSEKNKLRNLENYYEGMDVINHL